MEIPDRVCVVTGGAAGIGEALCRRFAAEGAAAVIVADVDADGAQRVADAIGGHAAPVNVAVESDVRALVERTLADHGRIDLMCSNAGIVAGAGVGARVGPGDGGPFAPDDDWLRSWQINVMSQVWAARAVLPSMLARGEGYLLNTASAAGLLTDLGSLAYSVTKHASVGLSEWLAITYGERGIGVSCLCPMGVRTPLLERALASGAGEHLEGDAIEPDAVAAAVVEGIAAERFLILPHPAVREFLRRKGDDPQRWLAGMARLRARLYEPPGDGG